MGENWTRTRKPSFNKKGAIKMDQIAKTVFKPIYPVIARNAMTVTGISRGKCLDLGSGPGMLAMAMAQEAPQMEIIAFDFSEDSRQIAMDNITQAHLTDRIVTVTGDVHAMPFEDNHVDLIVSRGSMFFWKDLKDAFREIYRVLSPGGATYIGGGFGSHELKEQVIREMRELDPTWSCYANKKTDDDGIKRFQEMFLELNCSTYQIIDDETGFWIVLTKPAG